MIFKNDQLKNSSSISFNNDPLSTVSNTKLEKNDRSINFVSVFKLESKTTVAANLSLVVNTAFGWIIVGRKPVVKQQSRTSFFVLKTAHAIEHLCELDYMGICQLPNSAKDEEQALKQFCSNLDFRKNRYEIF